ncbi:helix-turn-helix domain-containing protein [Bacillus sp. REN16]|uniref:helix-turn-helix domain-containing protein n=1 Tax=Bacillus sp. REN16 TaxID=2887296 RepID=UPI001E2BC709|nr:helix-turn-helix transcriptional regulator [Bacillus sp. REN16]MCC3359491.1 helix-turn-helix domain-containing protein [Bacillus sp. REN16]
MGSLVNNLNNKKGVFKIKDLMDLMELFEEYRVLSGLSMTKLSNSVGIDGSFYSRLVNGKRASIDVIKAATVAKILNVPEESFLDAIGYY